MVFFLFSSFPHTVFPIGDYFLCVHMVAKYIASPDMISFD